MSVLRKEVHRAALRAACRVAFSVASVAALGGCSSPNGDSTDEGQASNLTRSKDGGGGANEDASCTPGAKFTCEDLITAAFPGDDPYPGKKQKISDAVEGCCVEALMPYPHTAHRWACCASLDEQDAEKIGAACTPWGPPVPPAMKRRPRAAALEMV